MNIFDLVFICIVFPHFISISLSFFQLNANLHLFTVIGDNMNRRVSIFKIENQSTNTLADYRRGDIFLPNEILNVVIRVSKSNVWLFMQ